MTSSMKMHYLFVGNPGTGKSTMLNCLVQELLFKSGFSAGKGKTYQLQKETKDGQVYMDTPGLADVELREKAAAAISEALKQNGQYRIFFVLTLESGRVRPDDKATMDLVLNAAPIGQTYGVIINKLSLNAIKRLESKPEERDKILASIFANITATNCVHFWANDPDLEDADDALGTLPEELMQFIRNMPSINIKPEEVKDISGKEFEAMEAKYEKMLEAMKENSETMKQQIALQTEQMEAQNKRLEEQAKESAALREQLNNMPRAGGGGGVQLVPCTVM